MGGGVLGSRNGVVLEISTDGGGRFENKYLWGWASKGEDYGRLEAEKVLPCRKQMRRGRMSEWSAINKQTFQSVFVFSFRTISILLSRYIPLGAMIYTHLHVNQNLVQCTRS